MIVFEISNAVLKEFYVCASPLPAAALMKEYRERPPAPIAHWKKDQGVSYTEVETLADAKDADSFIATYAAMLARTGWKVLG